MQLNYTKPVCIEEFFKLRSEIAQLIYSHIDLMLFEKTKYERRSRELFDDLGLKNHEYNHMYERKRAIFDYRPQPSSACPLCSDLCSRSG